MSDDFNLLSFLKVNIPQTRTAPASPTPSASSSRIITPALKARTAAPARSSPRTPRSPRTPTASRASPSPKPKQSPFRTAYQEAFASATESPVRASPMPAADAPTLSPARSPQAAPRSPIAPAPVPARSEAAAPAMMPDDGADLTEAPLLPPPTVAHYPKPRQLSSAPIPVPPQYSGRGGPIHHVHQGGCCNDAASTTSSLTEKFGPECDLCHNAHAIADKADRLRQLRDEETRFFNEQQARYNAEMEEQRRQYLAERQASADNARWSAEEAQRQRQREADARRAENEAHRQALEAMMDDTAGRQAREAMLAQRRQYANELQEQMQVNGLQRQAELEADRAPALTSVPIGGGMYDPSLARAAQGEYKTELDRQVAERQIRAQQEREADKQYVAAPLDEAGLRAEQQVRLSEQHRQMSAEYQRALAEKQTRLMEEKQADRQHGAELAERIEADQARMHEEMRQMRMQRQTEMNAQREQERAAKAIKQQREKEYDAQFMPPPPVVPKPNLVECRTCHRNLPMTRFTGYREKMWRKGKRV
eukprot:gnl/Trimastix_PCT/3858.p1 GENE.gnl/Trimastix_PCT/3858~~gnl/Trimastix_PCT/3858.p1  ORF type:complete len:537 (+),score=173.57 gnl/Trimastix_PCT/3858:55-1665(+)